MEDAQKQEIYDFQFDYYISYTNEDFDKHIYEFNEFLNAKSFDSASKKVIKFLKKRKDYEMKLKSNKAFKIECVMLAIYNLKGNRIVEEEHNENMDYVKWC
jgi:hypothetical protein